LKVKHIIVCGHYGCGGVQAAMENKQFRLIDNWLRHIKDVYHIHHKELEMIKDLKARENRLVQLNVIEQVYDLGKTTIVQNAWERGQSIHIHGWVYDIHDGLINDLNVTIKANNDLETVYQLDDLK
jgi:carbonic anhydrase